MVVYLSVAGDSEINVILIPEKSTENNLRSQGSHRELYLDQSVVNLKYSIFCCGLFLGCSNSSKRPIAITKTNCRLGGKAKRSRSNWWRADITHASQVFLKLN